jgi:DNA polymerase III epsilon subunit-like protein
LRRVIFDTETGGFDAEVNAVLSAGLVLWEDGKIVDTLEIKIRDDKGICTPDALRVNRINLQEHFKTALLPPAAVDNITAWLAKNQFGMSERVELCGHNMAFDVPFLKRLYRMASRNYNNQYSYTMRCTMTLATMMKEAGVLLVRDVRLQTLMDYFGIHASGDLHSALVDAIGTAKVYTKLIQELQGRTNPQRELL